MRALTTIELLDAWAQGYAQPPPRQALTLLAYACPEIGEAELSHLTIGQRDGLLLTLREWTFGPHVTGLAECPQCGEALELAFDVAAVRDPGAPHRVTGDLSAEAGPPAPVTLAVGNFEVTFRAPNSEDLLALSQSAADGRRVLLERCILSVAVAGQPAVATLPLEEISTDAFAMIAEAVDATLEVADPQAEIELALSCPACNHEWQTLFDIVPFFWSELTTWAHHTLRQVHMLASAYGWAEADILSLPAWRRQYYLDTVGG